MNNIMVQDVGAEKDAITSLRAPTHFGRPNWDRVFTSIVEKHPETDVGVVSPGPCRNRTEADHCCSCSSSVVRKSFRSRSTRCRIGILGRRGGLGFSSGRVRTTSFYVVELF
jgi:hypothetical protein